MVTFDFKKTPITQIADYIISYASKAKASDIHFDPRDEGLVIRIRVDGDLQDFATIPKVYERNLITRLKLLANMNITESRLPQDGAIKGEFDGTYLDMRVSCLPTNEGEKIVIRILDYTRSLEGIEHLGFSHTNFLKLQRMIEVPNGIILVTGATGTGKSTTTYSILQALNKPETNIVTVEDPIEMNIEGLNQVQVNSEIGLDFSTVLRSILRQDPNVILIGEIRDSETAKIAVRASITGHLVLSTIHTNNSLSTIERLLDMDVERYLLASALTGIISQRLAKMLCPKCRIQREPTNYEKKIFKKFLNKDLATIYDANSKGCPDCHNGYHGRIAVQEVLEIDDDIRTAISNEKLAKEDLAKLVYTSNVITLLQDGLDKVLDGTTSFEEIYRIIEIDADGDDNYEIELTKVLDDNKKVEESTKSVMTGVQSLVTDKIVSNNINATETTTPIEKKIDNTVKPVQQTTVPVTNTNQPIPNVNLNIKEPKPLTPVVPTPIMTNKNVVSDTKQVIPNTITTTVASSTPTITQSNISNPAIPGVKQAVPIKPAVNINASVSNVAPIPNTQLRQQMPLTPTIKLENVKTVDTTTNVVKPTNSIPTVTSLPIIK